MNGHTPGPWHVQDVTPTEAHIAYEHKGQRLILGHIFDGAEFGSQMANARLIAAAPELLAALRTNLKLLESAGVVEGVAQQAARAAIAKATQLEEPK